MVHKSFVLEYDCRMATSVAISRVLLCKQLVDVILEIRDRMLQVICHCRYVYCVKPWLQR